MRQRRVGGKRGKERKNRVLGDFISLFENLYDGLNQTRIGRSRSIDIQDAALPILVDVADRFANIFIRIEGQFESSLGKLRVACAAEGASGFQNFNFRVAVRAL